MSDRIQVLSLSCDDKPGIVASVTTELAALGANIAESNQFWDRLTNRFFMRIAFETPEGCDRAAVERAIGPAVERYGMRTMLVDKGRRPKLVVMVSKFDHAMLHLLYQNPGRLAGRRGGGDRLEPRGEPADGRA